MMNEKETSICWMLGFMGLMIYGFVLYAISSPILKARSSGQKPRMDLVFASLPLHVIIFFVVLIIWNHYNAQLSSQVDSSGVSWKTMFGRKKILWSEVTTLSFLPLRAGQKALLIQSKKQSFKVELPLLKHPDEYVRFVETATHRKIQVGSGLF